MTPVTLTRPSKYTNGVPCYVTEHPAYPGIIGYGKEPEDARASFESARRAYDALIQQTPVETSVTMTFFRTASVIRGLQQQPRDLVPA